MSAFYDIPLAAKEKLDAIIRKAGGAGKITPEKLRNATGFPLGVLTEYIAAMREIEEYMRTREIPDGSTGYTAIVPGTGWGGGK